MAEATTAIDPDAGTLGADTSTAVARPANGLMGILQRLTGGQSTRQILPAAGAIVISVIGLAFFVISQQPERTTLYAALPEAEKARVVDALRNSGVDVALDPTTGDVIVPVADYHSSRMTLAAQGLPTSVPDGYSAVAEIPMGSSKSVENARLKQGQEIELARSISEIDGLVNIHVQVADVNGEIKFLHTVADGPCDDSYGVQVAALAGLPSGVVERARDLLIFLESQAHGARAGSDGTPDARDLGQSSLYGWMLPSRFSNDHNEAASTPTELVNEVIIQDDPILREISERLEAIDPDSLTPREALEALYAMRLALENTKASKDLEE